MIAVCMSGRNPTMRYLGRTHRVRISWLHEVCTSKNVNLVYTKSEHMAADIYAKAFTEITKWRHVCMLINILDPKMLKDQIFMESLRSSRSGGSSPSSSSNESTKAKAKAKAKGKPGGASVTESAGGASVTGYTPVALATNTAGSTSVTGCTGSVELEEMNQASTQQLDAESPVIEVVDIIKRNPIAWDLLVRNTPLSPNTTECLPT